LITKIETVEKESQTASSLPKASKDAPSFCIVERRINNRIRHREQRMDATRTCFSDAPTDLVDAIASKHDGMNVPLPAGETL